MQKRIILSAAAALMIGVSASAYAQTSPENCQAMFQKADVNKDGSLQAEEAKVFIDAMNQAEVKPQDASMVKQDEFMAACQKDAFANIDPATIGAEQSATATAEQPAAETTTTAEQPAAETTTAAEQPAPDTTAGTDQTASTTTTTDPAVTTQPPAEQALAVPDALMASNLIGANIYSANNENIAEIKDVVLSQDGGQATHVIADAGDNDVAIDFKQLKIAATGDGLKVVIDGTQADLSKFPVVNKQ